MFEIKYSNAALRDMKRIDADTAAHIKNRIMAYANNHHALANQVKRLQGSNLLRLRVGDYRVLFTAQGIVMHVQRVGHRREVYR